MSTPESIVNKLLETDDAFDVGEYLTQPTNAVWSFDIVPAKPGMHLVVHWNGQTVGNLWFRSTGSAEKYKIWLKKRVRQCDAEVPYNPSEWNDVFDWYDDVCARLGL
jgi:hypothetical protein